MVVGAGSGFEILEAAIARGFGHTFNSWTRVGEVPNSTTKKAVFYYLSGEVAAEYAPRFEELRLYHRTHRKFPPFTSGFRAHKKVVQSLLRPVWDQMGLAESTARIYTRRFALVPVQKLVRDNSAALHAVAQLLIRKGRVFGPELLAEIERAGGLTPRSPLIGKGDGDGTRLLH